MALDHAKCMICLWLDCFLRNCITSAHLANGPVFASYQSLNEFRMFRYGVLTPCYATGNQEYNGSWKPPAGDVKHATIKNGYPSRFSIRRDRGWKNAAKVSADPGHALVMEMGRVWLPLATGGGSRAAPASSAIADTGPA